MKRGVALGLGVVRLAVAAAIIFAVVWYNMIAGHLVNNARGLL